MLSDSWVPQRWACSSDDGAVTIAHLHGVVLIRWNGSATPEGCRFCIGVFALLALKAGERLALLHVLSDETGADADLDALLGLHRINARRISSVAVVVPENNMATRTMLSCKLALSRLAGSAVPVDVFSKPEAAISWLLSAHETWVGRRVDCLALVEWVRSMVSATKLPPEVSGGSETNCTLREPIVKRAHSLTP